MMTDLTNSWVKNTGNLCKYFGVNASVFSPSKNEIHFVLGSTNIFSVIQRDGYVATTTEDWDGTKFVTKFPQSDSTSFSLEESALRLFESVVNELDRNKRSILTAEAIQ